MYINKMNDEIAIKKKKGKIKTCRKIPILYMK